MDLEGQATRVCSMDDIAVGVDGAVGSAAADADSHASGKHSLSSSDECVSGNARMRTLTHTVLLCVAHAGVQVLRCRSLPLSVLEWRPRASCASAAASRFVAVSLADHMD